MKPLLREGARVRFKRPLTSVNVPPVKIARSATGTLLAVGAAWDLPVGVPYAAIQLDDVGEVTVPFQTCCAILELID